MHMLATTELLGLLVAMQKQASPASSFAADGTDRRSAAKKVGDFVVDHALDPVAIAGGIPATLITVPTGIGVWGMGMATANMHKKDKQLYNKLINAAQQKDFLYPGSHGIYLMDGKNAEKIMPGSSTFYHTMLPEELDQDLANYTTEGEALQANLEKTKSSKRKAAIKKKLKKLSKELKSKDGIFIQKNHINAPGILAHELGHLKVDGTIQDEDEIAAAIMRSRGTKSHMGRLRTILDEIRASEAGAQMLKDIGKMNIWKARWKAYSGVPTYIGSALTHVNPISTVADLLEDAIIQAKSH